MEYAYELIKRVNIQGIRFTESEGLFSTKEKADKTILGKI